MNHEEIQDALNEHRLLVLLEDEDGKFKQVMLSPKRFKKVSDACVAHKDPENQVDLRKDYEAVCVHMKENWEMPADAFLGLASYYEEADDCG